MADDPFRAFSFQVEIDGIAEGGFAEVSGLGISTDVIEFRNGSDKGSGLRKVTGLARYGDVTLRRGMTRSLALYEWMRATTDGLPDVVRNVTIILFDSEGVPVRRWRLVRARIIAHFSGPFDAATSAIAMETIVLAHERLEIE